MPPARRTSESQEARAQGRRGASDSGGWHVIALFDALGRRKALRLVWELRGKRSLNFRQLAEACEVSPSVLNTRLRELRDLGLVEHEALAGYSLTKRGNELLAHLLPLYKWSRGWMSKG